MNEIIHTPENKDVVKSIIQKIQKAKYLHDTIIPPMEKAAGITEQFRSIDQLRWGVIHYIQSLQKTTTY